MHEETFLKNKFSAKVEKGGKPKRRRKSKKNIEKKLSNSKGKGMFRLWGWI